MYGTGSPAGKPPRTPDAGSSTPSKRDRVAARRAHAERVPVVVDHDAGGVGGDLRVAVALDAVVVGEGDGDVELGRGRRHRAEDLAAVDPPARLGARGARRRAGEVLPGLADGGGDHDAVAGDRLRATRRSARARRSSPAATAICQRRAMLSTTTRCMFTPIATEASPRARRLDATTRSCTDVDAEAAELGGDRARRSSPRP